MKTSLFKKLIAITLSLTLIMSCMMIAAPHIHAADSIDFLMDGDKRVGIKQITIDGKTYYDINGGEGGLGVATIQLAKHIFGAKVVAQVASDENGEFCKGVGADVVSNRFKDDLVKTLSENPPNVAIDPVGGPLMGKCIATMPYRGRWISLASIAGNETTLDVNLLWRKNLRVVGSTLRSRTSAEKAQILAGLVREVWPAFEARRFTPFVHKVMPLTEAAEAHRIMAAGENRGKIVLAT